MSSQRGHDPSRDHGHARSPAEPGHDGRVTGNALQEAAGNQAAASLLGGETSLSPSARALLEATYGADLGRVRIHSGPDAAAQARKEQALAFTRGEDIYLGASAAAHPRVLAHELAHVVQQTAGGDQRELPADVLEQQAASGSDVSTGTATPGSVQRWSWPWEDEREQAAFDPEVERQLLGQLSVNKDAWKRHLDDPASAKIMRSHSLIQHSYADDSEFQKWMANPAYRPAGVESQRVPSGWSSESETSKRERAAKEAQAKADAAFIEAENRRIRGPVTPLPREGEMLAAPQRGQQADWATRNLAMSPAERAREAYETGTSPKAKMEIEAKGPVRRTYIGPHERSLLAVEQGLKSVPFVRAAVPIVNAVSGDDILGRPVSRAHAAGEAVTDIVLDFGSLAAPEDLIALGGDAKAGAAVEEGVAATTPELDAKIAQHGIELGPEVAPIEDVLEHTATPTGISPEAAAGAKPLSEASQAQTAAKITPPAAPASPPGVVPSNQPSAAAVKIAETTETTRVIQQKYGHLGVRDVSDLTKSTNAGGPDRLFVIGSGDDIMLVEVDAKLSVQETPATISEVSSFETQAKTGGAGRLELLKEGLAKGTITPAEFDVLKHHVEVGVTKEEVVGVGSVKGISEGLSEQGVAYSQGEQFAHAREMAAAQAERQASLQIRETVLAPPADKRQARTIANEIWDAFTKGTTK